MFAANPPYNMRNAIHFGWCALGATCFSCPSVWNTDGTQRCVLQLSVVWWSHLFVAIEFVSCFLVLSYLSDLLIFDCGMTDFAGWMQLLCGIRGLAFLRVHAHFGQTVVLRVVLAWAAVWAINLDLQSCSFSCLLRELFICDAVLVLCIPCGVWSSHGAPSFLRCQWVSAHAHVRL